MDRGHHDRGAEGPGPRHRPTDDDPRDDDTATTAADNRRRPFSDHNTAVNHDLGNPIFFDVRSADHVDHDDDRSYIHPGLGEPVDHLDRRIGGRAGHHDTTSDNDNLTVGFTSDSRCDDDCRSNDLDDDSFDDRAADHNIDHGYPDNNIDHGSPDHIHIHHVHIDHDNIHHDNINHVHINHGTDDHHHGHAHDDFDDGGANLDNGGTDDLDHRRDDHHGSPDHVDNNSPAATATPGPTTATLSVTAATFRVTL